MKNSCFLLFLQKCVFLILEKKVWHYVALCGAMKNSCFLLFLQKCVFLILEKKVWHYVALWKIAVFCFFCENVFFDFGGKKCGTMWRYVALWKIAVFCCFCKNVFFLILEKKVWHYVALWKIAVFCCFCKKCVFFDFGEKSVALCGAMWRYEK